MKTEKEKEKKEKEKVEPQLSVVNTAAKLVLDQTVGAAANTFLFSFFMNGIKVAAAAGSGQGGVGTADWTAVVVSKSQEQFWGMMRASWTFWPFVALFNYTLVTGVQARNLVGSLAGAAWGVYVSMVAAK